MQKYVDDKANHVEDPGLAARFTTAMQGINGAEAQAYARLDFYSKEIFDTVSSGSNDEWRSALNDIFRDTQSKLVKPV